jgi:hypothetical protein
VLPTVPRGRLPTHCRHVKSQAVRGGQNPREEFSRQ